MNEHKQNDPKKLTLKQSLAIILLSVCLISGSSFATFLYYRYAKDKQRSDPAYQIIALVQTTPERQGLKTSYLTEVLDLSIDKPCNLYCFNTAEALEKLMRVPVIKEASIRKIRPGTIHVDYTLRQPIAYLGDYVNAAIDASGTIFPFKPFYTPKRLPELRLGIEEGEEAVWGTVISDERQKLAFELLQQASQYCDPSSSLSCVDVSYAFAPGDGQRQMILLLEDRIARVVDHQTVLCLYPRILRLRQENYHEQLGNYLVLRSYLRERDSNAPLSSKDAIQVYPPTVIDLRLSELAFIK